MRKTACGAIAISSIALYAIACGSSSSDGVSSGSDAGSQNVSSKGEQENGACPSSPKDLSGSGAAGAPCTTFADCRPSCCACSVGSSAYLGAACIDGVCADKTDTCFRAKSASFCPGDPIDVDGGTTDGGADPKKDGGTGPTTDPTCAGPVEGCWQTCINNNTSTTSCASTCAIGNGVGCYKLAEKNGTSTTSGTATCGTTTPTAERACYDLCIKNGTSTTSCAASCGTKTGCGQEGCFAVSVANGTSTTSGAATCGTTSGVGQFGCYALAIKNGTSTTSAAATCGTTSACGQRGCMQTCVANGTSTTSCAATCGTTTSCGKVGCFDVCIKNGTSTTSCAATCGTTGPACDECGVKETPRDACYRVCANNNTSTSSCAATCGT